MRALPRTLPGEGLLVGWSLEPGRRRPVIGFRAGADDTTSPARTLEPILDDSESHLITVAPTGAGKGVSCIIPALLRYPGPVVVVDPKGENLAVTARARREMGQEVIVLDPFGIAEGVERHRFNPLDLADPRSPGFVEDVAMLAQLASTNAGDRSGRQDPFWPQMGRTLVTAAVLDVLTMADSEEATLSAVREVVNRPVPELALRAKKWGRADHPELRRMAGLLNRPAGETVGGYWAMAVNHLDFLKGEQVAAHLAASDLDLNRVHDGAPLSIYLLLPPDKMESHAALLRLWIGTLTAAVTRRRTRPKSSTLFIVDEAAQLGELPQLRQAITLLRGYGVRVWSFWQDLSQLRRLYPNDWETILNNCRVQQFFGASTALAADAVVEASGFGPREAVLDLGRDEMILNLAGDAPVVARKPNYRIDPPFQERFDDNPFYAGVPDDSEVHARPVFRRTQAPKTRREERSLREVMTLAQGLFHPVPGRAWVPLEGAERAALLDMAGIDAPTLRAEDGLDVHVCTLPFYDRVNWVELADRGKSPARIAYILLGEGQAPVALVGSSSPIQEFNARCRPRLTRETVAQYLEFFCSSMTGDEGRFLVIDHVSEIEWREPPDESIHRELAARIRAPRVTGGDAETGFELTASVLYGDTVFEAQFSVAPDGTVEMTDDTPLVEDLDVIPDEKRLGYIGRFNADGTFSGIRERA
jgi:type IV secretion system protein VirD4